MVAAAHLVRGELASAPARFPTTPRKAPAPPVDRRAGADEPAGPACACCL
jgi:hypothetical protein